MTGIRFETLSAHSPFVDLRGFVKEHGLQRNGLALKATRKADLYVQIVEAWQEKSRTPVDDASDVPTADDRPDAPNPDVHASHADAQPAPLDLHDESERPVTVLSWRVLVDTLFPDRLDSLKARYPFFNGLDSASIGARVDRYIRDQRVADGTLLYVGTASEHPERGIWVVQNGRAAPWQPGSFELDSSMIHELIAHGSFVDENGHNEAVRQRHRVLVRPDQTVPHPAPPNHPRKQWQHHPVQLAYAECVLHPPEPHHPHRTPNRRTWAHRPVTLFNANVTLHPRPSTSNPSLGSTRANLTAVDAMTSHGGCVRP